jgi:hypothetical protein
MLFVARRDCRSTMGGSEISSLSERFELSMSSMSPAFRKREERDWSGVENLLAREQDGWGNQHALFLAPFARNEGSRPPEASAGSKSSRRWARALKEAAAEDKGKLLSETGMARPHVST